MYIINNSAIGQLCFWPSDVPVVIYVIEKTMLACQSACWQEQNADISHASYQFVAVLHK